MFGLRRRKRRSKGRDKSTQAPKSTKAHELSGKNSKEDLIDGRLFNQCGFADHMAGYIGQTVTVFVSGGGASGSGFTGILLSVHISHIQLITFTGPIPACSIGNACNSPYTVPNCGYSPSIIKADSTIGGLPGPGSVTHIPLNKITSFVHNSV